MDDFISASISTLLSSKQDSHDPIDLLRSINSISKQMMDTLSLRESLIQSDPNNWTNAVAACCSVPKYTRVESLDGSTRIKAQVVVEPGKQHSRSTSQSTSPITISFDYERKPHELPNPPQVPPASNDEQPPIRPLSYNKGTIVTFTVTAALGFEEEVPLIMLEIEGKRDRPLKDCVSREELEESDSDESDSERKDHDESNKDTYAVMADEDGMELLRKAFEGACSPEDAEDIDDQSLIYSILTFGFYDTEWDVPKCIVEGLFGGYDDDGDDSDVDVDEDEDEDGTTGGDHNATPMSVEEGSKQGDETFEIVD
ncbi:hypothetical protein TL16_g12887 [Triparma laevis f. inornata]|uniref:Uncharacterized protein n=1 Tax=Triparma laevis f. inornata TaxID=1714386 RepID=A0A9W7EXS0_9STRA|nr:hypothetical protein TL16_g12887 [Triparma laevis f. inornata]